MIDVAYTHLLPIELIVAAIVASGLWVGLSGTMTADPRDMAVRGHRILCALALAALMYRPAQLLAAKGERKSTRLNSSHYCASRMPASAWKKKNKQKPPN